MNRSPATPAEKLAWIRLAMSENVGPATFDHLLRHYGSASEALEALPEISRRGGMARPLRIFGADEAEAALERASQCGAAFVTWDDPGYPPLLGRIDLPPPFLTIKGDAALVERPCLAIVGARNASALGCKFARNLANELGQAGYVIVSGLARGIDTAAHEGSISSGTLAVLAGGIDVVYPPENERLQARIGETGLLMSEMLPGTVPRGVHFPRRNRIISGTSIGVVVVEAALRSGSLITARLAGEQGRDVFAVPGSPLDPRAQGTNRLIREGATLVSAVDDILEVLGNPPRTMAAPDHVELAYDLSSEQASETDRSRIARLLSPAAVDLDTLIRESGASPAVVVTVLLELELAGKITRHSGQLVSLA
ncbi:MAG: DNA-protecting protein DprA [Rhizobiales bacterium]|nr:DNA-protecting protein DprA [Hyphomicrobiales bacterium]